MDGVVQERLDLDLDQSYTQRVECEREGLGEDAFPPAEVDVEPLNTNVYAFVSRIEHGEIDLSPSYERNRDLWSDVRKSQLIESLILRIPVPAFYFTVEAKTDGSGFKRTVWHVVDGLQRLCAIANFVAPKGARRLRLKGLEYLRAHEGKSFDELPSAYQRNILEAQVIAFLVRQGTPDYVKFNIFKRVNRGGIPLNQQEIRHALHVDGAAVYLRILAETKSFKDATHKRFKPKRMVDREVVNRFLAFYLAHYDLSGYDSMDAFLNRALDSVDKMDLEERNAVSEVFTSTLDLIHRVLGDLAFRRMQMDKGKPRAAVNKAIFEALTVTLALRTPRDRELFEGAPEVAREEYKRLFADRSPEGLEAVIGVSTGHRWNIMMRHRIFESYVDRVLEFAK